jgi:hypothetical protein
LLNVLTETKPSRVCAYSNIAERGCGSQRLFGIVTAAEKPRSKLKRRLTRHLSEGVGQTPVRIRMGYSIKTK